MEEKTFRAMRRIRQALNQEEIKAVIKNNTYGVLSLSGDNGYPYGVPLNYIYQDGVIYFHCAKSGHKLDAVKSNSKCSLCIVDQSRVCPEEYTTYYRSVIVFGSMEILTAEEDLRKVAAFFADTFNPGGDKEYLENYYAKEIPIMTALKMNIEHLTGKEAAELVNQPKKG